jgi:hypothetical protein
VWCEGFSPVQDVGRLAAFTVHVNGEAGVVVKSALWPRASSSSTRSSMAAVLIGADPLTRTEVIWATTKAHRPTPVKPRAR